MASTLTGTLNMLTATIDWRDEVARCVGVFRSENAAVLEVEYKVHLDQAMLDLLARAFLKAGVPILRGSEATLPNVRLLGDTLSDDTPPRASLGQRIDKRTRAWKELQKARVGVEGPTNGNNGKDG